MSAMQAFHEQLRTAPQGGDGYLQALVALTQARPEHLAALQEAEGWEQWWPAAPEALPAV